MKLRSPVFGQEKAEKNLQAYGWLKLMVESLHGLTIFQKEAGTRYTEAMEKSTGL